MPFLHSIKTHRFDISVVGYYHYSNLFFRINRKEYDREHSIHNQKYNSEKNLKLIKLSQKRHPFPCFHRHGSKIFKASITVEAALALPLMIFAIYFLIYPLKVMEAERKLQNVMEITAKEISKAEYLKETGEKYIAKDKKDVLMNMIGGIEEGAGMAYVLASVDRDRFEFPLFTEDTSILSNDSGKDPYMIYMNLSYNVKQPVSAFEILPLKKSIVVNRRAWVGSKGGRGRSKYSDEYDEDEEDPDRIVYLGKTSSEVYHEDPNCHYLSNKLSVTDASKMKNLRNSNGGKYHACPSCKPGASGSVYYFENGTAYHSSEHCKAITAYSKSVKLSEIHGMRPCSYCGKHKKH